MSANETISVDELISGESQTTAPADSPEVLDPVEYTPEAVQSESTADSALPDQSTDPLATDGAGSPPPRIIHFVHDGFTTLGRVWQSGEELLITPEVYEATVDAKGHSILDYTEADQVARYGKLIWHDGPVPVAEYAVQEAQHAQTLADQARRPPVIPLTTLV